MRCVALCKHTVHMQTVPWVPPNHIQIFRVISIHTLEQRPSIWKHFPCIALHILTGILTKKDRVNIALYLQPAGCLCEPLYAHQAIFQIQPHLSTKARGIDSLQLQVGLEKFGIRGNGKVGRPEEFRAHRISFTPCCV